MATMLGLVVKILKKLDWIVSSPASFIQAVHPSFLGGVKFKFGDHEKAPREAIVGLLRTMKSP